MKRFRDQSQCAADLERVREFNSNREAKAGLQREAKAAYARQNAIRGKLANEVRAGGEAAADAWLQLRPMLIESTQAESPVRAARARALLSELTSLCLAPARAPAPPQGSSAGGPTEPLRLLSLFDGWGGGVAAFAAALNMSADKFRTPPLQAVCVHAGNNDVKQKKTAMAAAVAPLLSPVRFTEKHQPRDILDESFYTADRVRSWGPVDVAIVEFPITFHSEAASRTSAEPFGFRIPACMALANAFIGVIELVMPRTMVVECSDRLCSDPLYRTAFLARLKGLGYHVYLDGRYVLGASSWLSVERWRTYVICFQDEADYLRFTGATPPQRRESSVARALLDVGDSRIPRRAWDSSKSARSMITSQAAQAARAQPLGAVGVFTHNKFHTAKKRRRMPASGVIVKGYQHGVLPTLIHSSSGFYCTNTARGSRTLCALECGRLLGVQDSFIEAMRGVASDAQVTAALVDGVAIPVLRDVLRAMMRACRWGV